jgi:hypothetical protein
VFEGEIGISCSGESSTGGSITRQGASGIILRASGCMALGASCTSEREPAANLRTEPLAGTVDPRVLGAWDDPGGVFGDRSSHRSVVVAVATVQRLDQFSDLLMHSVDVVAVHVRISVNPPASQASFAGNATV